MMLARGSGVHGLADAHSKTRFLVGTWTTLSRGNGVDPGHTSPAGHPGCFPSVSTPMAFSPLADRVEWVARFLSLTERKEGSGVVFRVWG